MIIASVNAGKRLGGQLASSRFRSWLERNEVALALVQEAWRDASVQSVSISGMSLVAGDAELAVWVRDGEQVPRVERPAGWWQVVALGHTRIHSVYLDPYSSAERIRQLQMLTAELPPGDRNVVVGDFNLAPRPSDGRYGDRASAFTSEKERRAFTELLEAHGLVDATAAEPPIFTFSRRIRGAESAFRCDLALLPSSLPPSTVTVSGETRTGDCAFTDHSGLLVDLDLDVAQASRPVPVAQPAAAPAAAERRGPTSLAGNSFKTAIARKAPSAPAVAIAPYIKRWMADTGGEKLCREVLDYGCGRGADLEYYRSLGFDADGYDPHAPFGVSDLPEGCFQVVTLIFVLNVLPTPTDRAQALRDASAHLAQEGRLVVATRSAAAIRSEAARKRWRPSGDGFVSHEAKGTFQRGMSAEEISALAHQIGLQRAEALPTIRDASLVALAMAT